MVQKKVVEKCQLILNQHSNLDWATITFQENGIAIYVDGVNGAGLYPGTSSLGYSTHNLDTTDQCLTIYLFLTVIIKEFLEMIEMWEKEETKNIGVENSFVPQTYRLNKPIETKKPKLFALISPDESHLDPDAFIQARTFQEACALAELNPEFEHRQVISYLDEIGAVFVKK